MEDYTYHLPPGPGGPRGAHARGLPVDRRRAAIVRDHPLSIGGRADPVRLVFDAAPGPARVVGLADLGDRFRLLVSVVDVVEPDRPLGRLPVARAVWRPRPDFATAAEAWLMAGGPHHTALTSALGIEALTDFADIADVELLVIDEGTSVTAFKHELRWNQAYHFLKRGM